MLIWAPMNFRENITGFAQPPPASVQAGALFDVFVNLIQKGHVASGDNSTVTLSLTGPAGGTLNGTLQKQAISGFEGSSRTYPSPGRDGTYTLNATDGTDTAAAVNFVVTTNDAYPRPELYPGADRWFRGPEIDTRCPGLASTSTGSWIRWTLHPRSL